MISFFNGLKTYGKKNQLKNLNALDLFINKKDVYEIHIFSCKELFFSVHSLRYGLKKIVS